MLPNKRAKSLFADNISRSENDHGELVINTQLNICIERYSTIANARNLNLYEKA